MRSKLLIASIFAALSAGTGIAVAQIADDPPGSLYQTQGILESDEGVRGSPYVYIRAARAAAARQTQAYAPAVQHHKAARHHRNG
jgi:hypothetical protein